MIWFRRVNSNERPTEQTRFPLVAHETLEKVSTSSPFSPSFELLLKSLGLLSDLHFPEFEKRGLRGHFVRPVADIQRNVLSLGVVLKCRAVRHAAESTARVDDAVIGISGYGSEEPAHTIHTTPLDESARMAEPPVPHRMCSRILPANFSTRRPETPFVCSTRPIDEARNLLVGKRTLPVEIPTLKSIRIGLVRVISLESLEEFFCAEIRHAHEVSVVEHPQYPPPQHSTGRARRERQRLRREIELLTRLSHGKRQLTCVKIHPRQHRLLHGHPPLCL